jgi:enoyl-CoA hydratase/carnithine racemase
MLTLSREGAVFVLHMNDGENRMNDAFIDAFDRALDAVEAAQGVALVTRGEGKFYSNGIDLEWLLAAGANGARRFVLRLERLLGRVIGLPVPTVAAINGHAFAGGGLLALAHDFRVMRTDRGYFCLPEVDISVPFTEGLATIVRTRLAPAVAHEAMVTGRRYTAAEAAALAIVTSTAHEANVLAAAMERAQALTGKDRATLGAIKRNAYATLLEQLERGTVPAISSPS